MIRFTLAGRRRPRVAYRATLALAALVGLGGCVTVQPPGEAVPIGLDAARVLTPADAARVRWGGTVVSLANEADGNTTVELVARPLDARGRPVRNDRSAGRFRAVFDGLLDPEIVRAGRDMTVIGTLDGVQSGTIGETPYDFPIVRVEDHRYWRTVTAVVDPCHTRWMNHGYGYHQHDPFYCGTPFGRSHLGRPHGPWLSDWPHPFRGHGHGRHRHGSGVRLHIGIGG